MADFSKETTALSQEEETLDILYSKAIPSEIEPPIRSLESSDDITEDNMEDTSISDAEAESIVGVSMSRAASRLKSPNTPALEKERALADAGGFFESDPETPEPIQESTLRERDETGALNGTHARANEISFQGYKERKELLSVPRLPPNSTIDTESSPRRSEPKPQAIRITGQSSLAGVFGGERKRSLSGSAAAFKKLLPNALPSMATVGQFFSSGTQGSRTSPPSSLPKGSEQSLSGHSSSSETPTGGSSPRTQTFSVVGPTRLPPGPRRPTALRRVTSDDSLLYNSLSRTSSLGDDTRFENTHEQVNSRVKAIRDSLQDRSSFRMPQMPQLPSLPSMPRVHSFGFNMNFLNSNTSTRWRPDIDEHPDILPDAMTTRKLSPISKSTNDSGIMGAAISKPEVVKDVLLEGSNTQFLDRAIENLVGDVVIMGGYRGSILRSAKTNRQVWVPVKVGLNIRKVDLEVGLEPEDEERMEETIYPSGMLQNIGPVDISKRLFKRLNECENAQNGKLRVHNYGYDWRLSPHLLSRKLTAFLEKLESNKPGSDGKVPQTGGVLVIAHSLGGLITRHVVNQRPELFAGVIYAGVPQSCVNILGPIRNGDAVLLSSRVLTAQVNFTLRTSFLLLPEDGRCFVDINTKEKYPVDFFNIDAWIKYRFSPCTDPPLPPRNQNCGGLGSILNLSGSLLSLPLSGKKSTSGTASPQLSSSHNDGETSPSKTTGAADMLREADGAKVRTIGVTMGNNSNPVNKGQSTNSSISTTVTIPREKAIAYLKRTLAETKKFKQELHFKSELSASNSYPPLAIIYGKAIPTCCGAKIDGREGIPCSDSYDNLAFASGDGVCLAKEAQLPEGYKSVFGGRIKSDRGHVTLLGDLNAVGRAIEAVSIGRSKGIGLGLFRKSSS